MDMEGIQQQIVDLKDWAKDHDEKCHERQKDVYTKIAEAHESTDSKVEKLQTSVHERIDKVQLSIEAKQSETDKDVRGIYRIIYLAVGGLWVAQTGVILILEYFTR